MSFIKELKHRNIIKVAIAYIVTAWLLLQIADVVLRNIGTPDWVFQTLLLLLILGFPLALIFAWAFELTPEGIKLEKDVVRSESITHITGRKLDFIIITVLVLSLVYFAYDEFVIEPVQEEALATASTQAEEVSETDTSEMSVAVLAFVNMSDDPGNEYFSDGLSEEILNLLAKIPSLKVIGRTSSFAFKGKNEDLRVIGQALDVKTVLEGSVRKSGDRVRITAQLVDVADGAHIWSETYDRTMTDIFAVQDDVAAAIIDALQIHIGANPTRGRPTANSAAYALFLKARVAVNVSEWRNAKEYLLEAIEFDSNFAEAYELLAFYYWSRSGFDFANAEGRKLTAEAAGNALAIDPDLVFAQALLESSNVENSSYLRKIEAFERAAREQRSNSTALQALSFYLLEFGYLREAVGIAERLVELDPLSADANLLLFESLYAVGRTSEAIAALETADHLGNFYAKSFFGAVNLVAKRNDIAIAYLEAALEQEGFPDSTWVRELVDGARDPATGQAYLDRRIPQIIASMPQEHSYVWWLRLTLWYQIFGFPDRHFEIILATVPADSTWTSLHSLVWVGTMFRRLGFTAHPKYLEVAELLGIVDLWEQRGPPDFCEKVGGEWVCE